jgi:hypothetical protein
MKTKPAAGFRQGQRWVWSLLLTIMCGLGPSAFSQIEEQAEPRGSLAGERAIEELKREQTNEVYNVHYGRIGFQVGARLGAAYTDNVFLSGLNRLDDFILRPEVTLGASVPLTELNTLKLSLGVGYEWFAKNQSLNGDAPLVSPDSELMFTMFVKDFRIRLHDQFSYQQTLVFNDQPVNQTRIYNFTNVSRFDRLDNFVGPTVDWDLNKVILTLGYDHENFVSTTEQFK